MTTKRPPEHYLAFAERLWFSGISERELGTVAKYKPGKTFQDVYDVWRAAVEGNVGHTGMQEFEGAVGLLEVIEIDTDEDLGDFRKRLRDLEVVE